LKDRITKAAGLPARQEAEASDLSLTRLYEVGRKIEAALPEIVDDLLTAAKNPISTTYEKIAIFKEMKGFVLAAERMAKDMGLARGDEEKEDLRSLMRVIFGTNLEDLRKLPPGAVDEALETEVDEDGVFTVRGGNGA
jgi:hypothetical protein